MKNLLRLLLLALATIELSGCSTLIAPNYSPSYEAVDKLKKTNSEHLSVGTVQPTNPTAQVNNISLRAASLKSPSGTFSKYLENALISDLTEMGFYDASSTTRIEINIIKNDIDISGFSEGSGILEAKLKVIRGGIVTLDKTYLATTKFESSFAGAVAIPKGQTEYPNLVRTFLGQIYLDPEFIQAIKK